MSRLLTVEQLAFTIGAMILAAGAMTDGRWLDVCLASLLAVPAWWGAGGRP